MYDLVIIGGGLSGLTSAILLGKAGLKTLLIEKNEYPFHRVCGEYISKETLPFLQKIGVDPFSFGAVSITDFTLTSPKGNFLDLKLDLGGFGISRYLLDNQMFAKAKENGTNFLFKEKVISVKNLGKTHLVSTESQSFETKNVIGTYGKRTNLDNFLKRSFFTQKSPYIGVKYHIKTNLQADHKIALHNFADGYCGMSRVENDIFCLCYLTTRQNLKQIGDIKTLEKQILSKNPFLKQIFEEAEFVWEKPQVINEISFAKKPLIENGILMAGDSAGMIAPLCGNGMTMAIHGAKILSELLILHFEGKISKTELEKSYQKQWSSQFSSRLWAGRNLQKMFGNPILTEILLQFAKKMPAFANFLVAQTHGKEF